MLKHCVYRSFLSKARNRLVSGQSVLRGDLTPVSFRWLVLRRKRVRGEDYGQEVLRQRKGHENLVCVAIPLSGLSSCF